MFLPQPGFFVKNHCCPPISLFLHSDRFSSHRFNRLLPSAQTFLLHSRILSPVSITQHLLSPTCLLFTSSVLISPFPLYRTFFPHSPSFPPPDLSFHFLTHLPLSPIRLLFPSPSLLTRRSVFRRSAVTFRL